MYLRILKTFFLLSAILLLPRGAEAASVTFAGTTADVISIEPDSRSGLDAIYVVDRTSPALQISFESTSSITWWRYGANGGAYAEQLTDITHNGNRWTLTAPAGNAGYMIEIDGGGHYYFWLCDYSTSPFEANSIEVAGSDCSGVELHFDGKAERMTYYSINGRALEIDRGITISYTTEQFDEESGRFANVAVEENRAWLGPTVSMPAPYCTTRFTVSGDRFLSRWQHKPDEATSASFRPVAVDAHTSAEQNRRDSDNEQGNSDNEALGGSAPAEITFSAAVTEAAIFTEWQISRSPEFDPVTFSTNDTEFDYTFQEMGTFYVRFLAANDDASCDFTSDTYSVFVGESALICPNAFSPGASEGVNDIWKVSYKSIIKFECHIYNKWGVKMAEFTNPADGWDGKYNGKVVPAGVYYYVIKATGADGRKYDRSGDINIVNYR